MATRSGVKKGWPQIGSGCKTNSSGPSDAALARRFNEVSSRLKTTNNKTSKAQVSKAVKSRRATLLRKRAAGSGHFLTEAAMRSFTDAGTKAAKEKSTGKPRHVNRVPTGAGGSRGAAAELDERIKNGLIVIGKGVPRRPYVVQIATEQRSKRIKVIRELLKLKSNGKALYVKSILADVVNDTRAASLLLKLQSRGMLRSDLPHTSAEAFVAALVEGPTGATALLEAAPSGTA